MEANRSILAIGLIPELVDFTTMPGMNAEKVRAGIVATNTKMAELGYDVHQALVDLGETAEAALTAQLAGREFAGVVIGAGVRVIPAHLLLFEKIINLVHAKAPRARI